MEQRNYYIERKIARMFLADGRLTPKLRREMARYASGHEDVMRIPFTVLLPIAAWTVMHAAGSLPFAVSLPGR